MREGLESERKFSGRQLTIGVFFGRVGFDEKKFSNRYILGYAKVSEEGRFRSFAWRRALATMNEERMPALRLAINQTSNTGQPSAGQSTAIIEG